MKNKIKYKYTFISTRNNKIP